jgi:hypothetical protein
MYILKSEDDCDSVTSPNKFLMTGTDLYTQDGGVDEIYIILEYPFMDVGRHVTASSSKLAGLSILGRIAISYTNSGPNESYVPVSSIQPYSLPFATTAEPLEIIKFLFVGYSHVYNDYKVFQFADNGRIQLEVDVESLI